MLHMIRVRVSRSDSFDQFQVFISAGAAEKKDCLPSPGSLRVRFFKKIQDWILKSERIRKCILRFFTKQINPRSFGSWRVKGNEQSTFYPGFS